MVNNYRIDEGEQTLWGKTDGTKKIDEISGLTKTGGSDWEEEREGGPYSEVHINMFEIQQDSKEDTRREFISLFNH